LANGALVYQAKVEVIMVRAAWDGVVIAVFILAYEQATEETGYNIFDVSFLILGLRFKIYFSLQRVRIFFLYI
jgi:hypothetical protein